jgi:hypothetical protein
MNGTGRCLCGAVTFEARDIDKHIGRGHGRPSNLLENSDVCVPHCGDQHS